MKKAQADNPIVIVPVLDAEVGNEFVFRTQYISQLATVRVFILVSNEVQAGKLHIGEDTDILLRQCSPTSLPRGQGRVVFTSFMILDYASLVFSSHR